MAGQTRRGRTRRTLLMIILGTLPCYCLGLIVLQVGQMLLNSPTATPTQTTPKVTATHARASITPVFTGTATLYMSPTVTPSPTITLTPSITATFFLPATKTPTLTPTVPTDTPPPPPTFTFTPSVTLPPPPTATFTVGPSETPSPIP
jgi:hypothetical protein